MLYKYYIQEIDRYGNRSSAIEFKTEKNKDFGFLAELDDIFIEDKNNVLKVIYNPSVSNYQINVTDNVIRTLGSEYPFITRNSANRYKTFSDSEYRSPNSTKLFLL